jgi:hypothetical protein
VKVSEEKVLRSIIEPKGKEVEDCGKLRNEKLHQVFLCRPNLKGSD